MGRAAPVLRARASRAMPPAPASQIRNGPANPKPTCTPQTAAPPMSAATAGKPSRKKAAKLSITRRSIRARVATIPDRPAAATVTPSTCGGAWLLTRVACAGPIGAPVAAARTSDQECQWAFALIVPAMPAGAALARKQHEAEHPAHRRPKRRRRGNESEDWQEVPRRRFAEQREERQTCGRPEGDPGRADDRARENLQPDQRGVVDGGVEQDLERALRLFPPDSDRALDRFEQRERKEEQRQEQPRLQRLAASETLRHLSRNAGQLPEERRPDHEQQDERVEIHHPTEVAPAPPRAHVERKRMAEHPALLSNRGEHARRPYA